MPELEYLIHCLSFRCAKHYEQ